MNSKLSQYFLLTLMGLFSANLVSAVEFRLIDSEGFESYTTAMLEGQLAAIDLDTVPDTEAWVADGGTLGTAVVQDSIFAPGGGDQAVKVDRAANADDFWGVPYTGAPSVGTPLICIEWDMYVEQATGPQTFGPFFGIDSYGDSISRVGTFGVDAATGEVLFIDSQGFLLPTPGGEVVSFDEWNSFSMILDYSSGTYYGLLNGSLILESSFVNSAATFTDAPIAAIAAGGSPADQAAIGTAYFDNYVVLESDDFSKIPEPSSWILASLCAITLAYRRMRS